MGSPKRMWRWLLLTLLAGGVACGGGGGGKEGDVLDQLGAKKEEAPRTDALKVHPLQKEYSVYKKRSELYLSGVSYWPSDGYYTDPSINGNAGRHQLLLDDKLDVTATAPKGYAPLYSSGGDQTWTGYSSTSTAANLAGIGGREWVVVLYYNPTAKTAFLRVIRPCSTTAACAAAAYEEQEFTLGGSFTVTPYWSFGRLQLAAGDLDGDGADELAVAIGNQVLIEKYQGGKFATLDSRTYTRENPAEQVTTVAIGDVDFDGVPEVVVVDGVNHSANSAHYYVYVLGENGLLALEKGGLSSSIMEKDQVGRGVLVAARVAIGDLDADGRNELVFSGDVDNSLLVTVVMKYNPTTSQFDIVDSTRADYGGGNWADQYVPALAVFNPDGFERGRKALLVYKQILWLDPQTGKLAERWAGLRLGDPWLDKVVVGDFTGDGKDDVAYLSADNATSLQIWSYESGSFHRVDYIDFDPLSADYGGYPYFEANLCAVNIDDDSTVVRYTGEYELLYSQPQIVAVLAAPPYYHGVDVSNAQTSFGWQHEDAYTSTETLGVYAGFSVGFSFETPFWGSAGSSEVKLNFDTSLDFTSSTSNSLSSTVTMPSQEGENYVVFSYTPLDVYYYQVVSSPVDGQKDKVLAIQLPRPIRISSMELGRYNGIVDAEYRVPEALRSQLAQALGDPWKYPTYGDMVGAVGDPPTKGFRSPTDPKYAVIAGGGPISFELDTNHDTAYGTDFNLSVGIEAQTVSGGVLVGGRAGFHYGYSQETSVGDGTVITGYVPGVPASMSGQGFVVGMFAYPYARADGGQFVVVNYWVEQ